MVQQAFTQLVSCPEAFFATGSRNVTSSQYSMDPADRLDFGRMSHTEQLRFDQRSDTQIRACIRNDSSPLERERALWELLDRHGSAALETAMHFARTEQVPQLRVSALWLIQKFGSSEALLQLSEFLSDPDAEVQDWAHLLCREISGRESHPDKVRPAQINPTNIFDQTLPLMIAGNAYTFVNGLGWIRATLSPLWFESILGRVMACTNQATFDSRLIIEKRLQAYHEDGSDHYEIYPFTGFTGHPHENVTEHFYESSTSHTFYPSGKVEDVSIPPLGDVGVVIARHARPIVVPPRMPIIRVGSLAAQGSPAVSVPERIVESVRGKYTGVAYVNVQRLLANNMQLGPGEVQLSSLHHPHAGPLTNTYLSGTFKGKLSDLNEDGCLDINTELCHSTLAGELDYHLTGVPDPDPFDPLGSSLVPLGAR